MPRIPRAPWDPKAKVKDILASAIRLPSGQLYWKPDGKRYIDEFQRHGIPGPKERKPGDEFSLSGHYAIVVYPVDPKKAQAYLVGLETKVERLSPLQAFEFLERELNDVYLFDEERNFIKHAMADGIKDWEQLEAELRAPYGAVFRNVDAGIEFQRFFQRVKDERPYTPREAAFVMAFHMYQASWKSPSQVPEYFSEVSDSVV